MNSGKVMKIGDKVIYHPSSRDRVNKLRLVSDGEGNTQTEVIQVGTVSHVATVVFIDHVGKANLFVMDSKGLPYFALDVTNVLDPNNEHGSYEAMA